MSHGDKRYNSRRWRERTRPLVLRRDLWRCQVVEGCQGFGNNVGHINPVHPGMTDAEFFDINNLRAACRMHNLARYYGDLLQPGVTPREHRVPAVPAPTHIFGKTRPKRRRVF